MKEIAVAKFDRPSPIQAISKHPASQPAIFTLNLYDRPSRGVEWQRFDWDR